MQVVKCAADVVRRYDLQRLLRKGLKNNLLGIFAVSALLSASASALAAPDNFSQAKRLMRDHVYFDQNQGPSGTFYCGCKWQWTGKSGGRIDPASCGLDPRMHKSRVSRIEWEHLSPISHAGQQRQCWRNGGRENCQKTDPVFNRMEADMHNLTPANGAANAFRSNLPFAMVTGATHNIGQCSSKFGSTVRAVEPRDAAKGQAARATFYMADRYNIRLSRQDQLTLMAWDKQHPVTAWELERDSRIKYSMGHSNPFVTGETKWEMGYRPKAEGLLADSQQQSKPAQRQQNASVQMNADASSLVYGNKRSGVYHLPVGCPSYNTLGVNNRVPFQNEAAAIAAGFRKAGNCSS